ncbi:hypothetical protein [Arthrobacter sp. D2-10]
MRPTRQGGLAVLLAVVVIPGCSSEAASPPYFQPLPVAVEPGDVFPLRTLYSGWWSTPAFTPGTAGLPLRVGLVRADTGELLAGYDRPAGRQVPAPNRTPARGWPAGAILAVDLATGAVWDWFTVDAEGLPTPGFKAEVSAEQGFPPIAGRTPPGTFHTFLRDLDSGEVIYLGTAPADLPDNIHIELDW